MLLEAAPGPDLVADEPDPDRPVFHILPRQGWLNDPNGLIRYRGRYHV